MDLDIRTLCNFYGDWVNIDRVMADWEKVTSPTVYWSKELSQYGNYRDRFETLELATREIGFAANLSYGLPTEEMLQVCRHRYEHDIAKLTVQIAAPDVMQIKWDIRVTFVDQIAVIGICMQMILNGLHIFELNCRRGIGVIRRR